MGKERRGAVYKNTKDKIYIKTFDGFDVYINGTLVYFPHAKAKELLAALVDGQGRYMSLSHLVQLLFEEKDEKEAKKTFHLIYGRLMKILKDYGLEDIILKKRGLYAINCDNIICDSYEMSSGSSEMVNYFAGEYMPEYSWAEVTLSNLVQEYFHLI